MPKDLTPQKILSMLLRHIKLIILIGALVTLIAYGYSSFFITPVYSASSLVMVQDTNEDFSSTQPTASYNNNGKRIDTSRITASSTIAASCVTLFSNNFLKFTASSSNPQVAANVANQLAEQAPKTFKKFFENKGRLDTIQSATAPSTPVSPNVNQNTLFGLGIGLVLGVLLAFFLEIIDTTLKPGDDLAKMYGLPVFAEIVDFQREG